LVTSSHLLNSLSTAKSLTFPSAIDGELSELAEDFSEGRIQFAFVKVKDPNTALPKYVLIAWCGGGVPERTKGYFTSHLAAVSKVLHGYHVQITARSDSDISPEAITQKVADASGAKYTSGGGGPPISARPPPVTTKPVFTPTALSAAGAFNPLVAARNRKADVDEDGWGADAPQITRSQLEKVESAYKPTKVNMADLVKQHQEPSGFGGGNEVEYSSSDVIKGGYQPVGKVDIAALRAQAQKKQDDRPTTVKGAYEPIGKVDIAAIRAKAQKPAEDAPTPEAPKSLAERSAAFSQSERLITLPKPKVANKFGSSGFTGTKAPTPGGLGFSSPPLTALAPVGAASRTFADQGGKTPAQIWAEKKARQGGSDAGSTVSPPMASPIGIQKSGEWKSGYKGKSWATVQTPAYGRAGPGSVNQQKTGDTDNGSQEAPESPGADVSTLRDRFKDAQPFSSAPVLPKPHAEEQPSPLPSTSSRPPGGFALPGLPSRPPVAIGDDEDSRDHDYEEPEASPVRIAMPVSRTKEAAFEPLEERLPPRPLPTREIEQKLSEEEDLEPEEDTHATARAAASAVAQQSFGAPKVTAAQAAQSGGKRAMIQYDYEKAEDNEIDLQEGQFVTNIEKVDDDWWMGTNSKGESGLFPSNYVEIVDDDDDVPAPAPAPSPAPAAQPAAGGGPTATAQFDYEAAEDNGEAS
jgi:drebrin-like protein